MNGPEELSRAIEALEALDADALACVKASGLVLATLAELRWHLEVARNAERPRDYATDPPPCSACRGRGTITPVDLDAPVATCPRCEGRKSEPRDKEPVHAYDEGIAMRCGAQRESVYEAAGRRPSWRITGGRATKVACADGVTCIPCLTAETGA